MHGLSDIIAMNEAKAREMTATRMQHWDSLAGKHGKPLPANDNRDAEPFSRDFNTFVLHMARECWPDGYRVVSGYNPGSLDQMRRDVDDADGVLTVDADNSDGTIFGDPTVNHAFRAWHDWCHLAGNYEFTLEGEAMAASMQRQHVNARVFIPATAGLFRDLITCEVVGQARYFEVHGEFPRDQRAFARAWLIEGETAALNRRY